MLQKRAKFAKVCKKNSQKIAKVKQKSSPKSFGNSRIATPHRENGLALWCVTYYLCNAHCNESNHSATGTLHPHHSATNYNTSHMLPIRYIVLSDFPLHSKICPCLLRATHPPEKIIFQPTTPTTPNDIIGVYIHWTSTAVSYVR